MGVDENGIPQVPDNPYDVVWYNWSTPPGHGSNAVFAGHVDWTVNGQPVLGVFYHIRDLEVGDIVEVKLEDGTDYKYSVIGNLALSDEDPQSMEWMGATPTDMVTLITCGGVWTPDPNDPLGGNYDHRQFIRAELIAGGSEPGTDWRTPAGGQRRMSLLRAILARLGAPVHWPQRRFLLAGGLLVASVVVFTTGMAGLLLAEESEPAAVSLDSPHNGLDTPTATPIPTPPPSNAPVARMIIEKLGIDAPVVTMGVDANGVPEVPYNPSDVVWYNFSSKPGWGSNAVFAGHVDWTVNGQPVTGVFYFIRDLAVGDIIEVKLEDGTDYKYKVVGTEAIPDDGSQGDGDDGTPPLRTWLPSSLAAGYSPVKPATPTAATTTIASLCAPSSSPTNSPPRQTIRPYTDRGGRTASDEVPSPPLERHQRAFPLAPATVTTGGCPARRVRGHAHRRPRRPALLQAEPRRR